MTSTRRALVLGGGGVAGVAWEIGVLAGLAERGVAVTTADRTVGTSAGSVVGSQLRDEAALTRLYAGQTAPLAPGDPGDDPAPSSGQLTRVLLSWQRLAADTDDPTEVARRIGRMALATETVPEEERRAVIAARLPYRDWPATDLAVVAVDAHSGAPRVFDRESGVDLLPAVAASCAVPGIWPPVAIGDSHYIDGGVRSSVNADYAAGCGRVLVLAPFPDQALTDQTGALRAQGAEVLVIRPDEASRVAFGVNPLDPATRAPAARAGRDQGRAAAAEAATLWHNA